MTNRLQTHLNAVRRRLRSALAAELVGRLFAGAAVLFWGGLVIDRWLEPAPTARVVGVAIALAVGVGWLARACVAPLLRRISDRTVAGWVERASPDLREALVTAAEPAAGLTPAERGLRLAAADHAERALDAIPPSKIVSFARPRRWAAAAAVGLASILIVAAAAPDVLGVYLRRVALSPEPWPRRVVLSVDGFAREADGRRVRRVRYGSGVELNARADLTGGHTAPPNVELRRRAIGGEAVVEVFRAIGGPTAGDDAHQLYRLAIDRVGEPMRLTLRGGDASLGPLWLIGETPPEVVSAEIEVREPEYLGGAARRWPLAAADPIPEGAGVTLHGRSSKPLSRVEAQLSSRDGQAAETGRVSPAAVSVTVNGEAFSVACPPLRGDAVLLLRLYDNYDITAEEAHLVTLAVVGDRQPSVTLALEGIGPTVTPTARLPTRVDVADDHGVVDARLTVTRTEAEDVTVALAERGERFATRHVVDLLSQTGGARPAPGQRLTISASATDAYDLDDEPRTATSRGFELAIVSPDALLARLQQQEVRLRQTFEATVDGVRRAAISLEQASEQGEADPSRRVLRVRRVADELTKSAQETLAAAEAFEQVSLELENNRVANEDLKNRIRSRVAEPLRRLGERSLPAAQETVESAIKAPAAGPAALATTRAALAEMQAVLEQMRSLGDYNEVLSMLRQIITEQESINDATRRAQRDGLRRLLLD